MRLSCHYTIVSAFNSILLSINKELFIFLSIDIKN